MQIVSDQTKITVYHNRFISNRHVILKHKSKSERMSLGSSGKLAYVLQLFFDRLIFRCVEFQAIL